MIENNFNIVIPCYNEASVIGEVIKSFQKLNPKTIIVVNDGSTDNTIDIVKKYPVILVNNEINRGQGFSLMCGLKKSVELNNSEYTIIADGDGQHTAKDLMQLISAIDNPSLEIIYAVRRIKGLLLSRRLYILLAEILFFLVNGYHISDPACGLRMIKNEVIKDIKLRDGADWYEDFSRFIHSKRNNSKKVYVEAHYTKYSISKGLKLKDGLKISLDILKLKLRSRDQDEREKNTLRNS